jgi:cyclic pyranopterin phosphate synthase
VSEDLTHLDEAGRARMVQVAGKDVTAREAVATAVLRMTPETAAVLAEGRLPKGDAFAVARVAGIMAAKRTPELIPLCHPIGLTSVSIDVDVDRGAGTATITATTTTTDRTGVEMEAMTAASVAALTLYDMVKGIERGAVVEQVRVESKRGGKSGEWTRS